MTLSKLSSLQALRALAAVAVVCHHSFRAVTVNTPPTAHLPSDIFPFSASIVELGAFGVDVFFILSGFLMVLISKPYVLGSKPISNFLLHRLIRVWPMYALATLLYLALRVGSHLARGDSLPFDMSFTRLMSFFFIPSFNEDGALQPILGVGWTLNYEILFYLAFAIAILLSSKWLLPALAAILLALFGLGIAIPAGNAFGAFLANPILFEFLFGAVVAYVYPSIRGSKLQAFAAILSGIALLLALSFVSNDSEARVLARGLPSLLIFYGFLVLEREITWPRWAIFIGDASYSIYLFHIIFVYPVSGKILTMLTSKGLVTSAQIIAAMGAVLVSIIIGSIVHILIEKPLTAGLQRLFRPRNTAIRAA